MQSSNKRILVITYFFPPLGGVPPRRSLRFVRNLSSDGWKPVVLTVSEHSKREPAWDYELLNLIDKHSVEVIKTKWNDVLRFPDMLGELKLHRLRTYYSEFCRRFPPDPYIGWYPYGVYAGMKTLKKHRTDLIYSNSAPFTVHLIALKLKKMSGLPWIADFRDPWLDDPLRPRSLFKWQERLEAKQEAKVIANADRVITSSESYAFFLKGKYPEAREKISTIYNGYDWPAGQDSGTKHRNHRLEFVYAGAFYGTQSPIIFIRALESLLCKGYIPEDKIRFTIVGGYGDESWKNEFSNSPVLKNISETGFVSNYKVREKLINADCLLLHQAPERGNLVVLGKTFEYISAGRPILALVPSRTECLNILERSGCLLKSVEPDSSDEIEGAILSSYKNWSRGKLRVNPDWEYISRFEGKNLARQFSELLATLTL